MTFRSRRRATLLAGLLFLPASAGCGRGAPRPLYPGAAEQVAGTLALLHDAHARVIYHMLLLRQRGDWPAARELALRVGRDHIRLDAEVAELALYYHLPLPSPAPPDEQGANVLRPALRILLRGHAELIAQLEDAAGRLSRVRETLRQMDQRLARMRFDDDAQQRALERRRREVENGIVAVEAAARLVDETLPLMRRHRRLTIGLGERR